MAKQSGIMRKKQAIAKMKDIFKEAYQKQKAEQTAQKGNRSFWKYGS